MDKYKPQSAHASPAKIELSSQGKSRSLPSSPSRFPPSPPLNPSREEEKCYSRAENVFHVHRQVLERVLSSKKKKKKPLEIPIQRDFRQRKSADDTSPKCNNFY